jgi:diguanylate cyclase
MTETQDTSWNLLLVTLTFVVSGLACFVVLSYMQRLRKFDFPIRIFWVLACSLGLGLAISTVHVLTLARQVLSYPVGYHAGLTLAVCAVTVMLMAGGVMLASRKMNHLKQVAAVGAGLGVGLWSMQIANVFAMGFMPGPDWSGLRLILAVLCSAGGLAAAFCLSAYFKPMAPWAQVGLRVAAAFVWSAGWVGSQQGVIGSVKVQQQLGVQYESHFPSATMAILLSAATLAVLLLLFMYAYLEAKMRASVELVETELHRKNLTDTLTSLPNRQVFDQLLMEYVQAADQSGQHVVVLFIGLDAFKPLNETLGHTAGDQVLSEVARRLRTVMDIEPQNVARLGGDEFLVLLKNNPSAHDAARIATRVIEAISQPIRVHERETSVSCSIGISVYPEDGSQSKLIAHADAAMHSAKSTGGAAYCFFEARMLSSTKDQVDMLRDLRQALSKGEMELYYQPKIHAPSGEITGAEALIRWNHPQRGTVSPMTFIPLAERFGLINSIGAWVIEESCRQARVWRDQGLRMRVAINLSVHQLRDPQLPDRIAAALHRNQINPRLLTCEITESIAMDDGESTRELFTRLSDVGVHISIDDFGTGYSSLSTLRKLPAEELKIDRSFVQDLETSNDAKAVVDAIVKLAQTLDLKVVAEGVETEAQHQILRSLGCQELQGYLFAKPMSARALSQWAINKVGPTELEFRPSLFGDTALSDWTPEPGSESSS